MRTILFLERKLVQLRGRNILRDPRVSICVDDHQYPYSFVSIFGEAEIFKSYRENQYKEDKNRKDESSEFIYWMKEIFWLSNE